MTVFKCMQLNSLTQRVGIYNIYTIWPLANLSRSKRAQILVHLMTMYQLRLPHYYLLHRKSSGFPCTSAGMYLISRILKEHGRCAQRSRVCCDDLSRLCSRSTRHSLTPLILQPRARETHSIWKSNVALPGTFAIPGSSFWCHIMVGKDQGYYVFL